MSNELTIAAPVNVLAETEDVKLDVSIFEDEEATLDTTSRIVRCEYDLNIADMIYIVHYLDANDQVVLRREIDAESLEAQDFARTHQFLDPTI